MKNKERIEQLEQQVQVLINRVALLEMRTAIKNEPFKIFPQPAVPTVYPNFTPYITCNTKH